MMRKSLLLLTTAMMIVPSAASYADRKDDRRERVRAEQPAKSHAAQRAQARALSNQRAPQTRQTRSRQEQTGQARLSRPAERRLQAGTVRTDRRDIGVPVVNQQRKASVRQDRNGRSDYIQPRQGRAVKDVRHTQGSLIREPQNTTYGQGRPSQPRQVRNTRRGVDISRDQPRVSDRRDVSGSAAFNMDTKQRNNPVPVTSKQHRDRGGNAGQNDDRRRGGNDHRGRGDDHRGRDGHNGRDRGRNDHYRGRDHHDRYRNHYYRSRYSGNTRIYIGLGTYPSGYWGGHSYYGYYSYGDWPFYSGYWHARSHWAWHMHHSHYHYGGYCPGVSHSYRTTYYREPSYYSSPSSNAGNEIAGTILGGVVGGILGSEIDGGRNRTAGIVVGSILGATLGNSIAKSNSRTVSSGYRYTADYYDEDPTIGEYESETYTPPRQEVRTCIEYDVKAGNYVCRKWTVEYKN